MEGNDIVHPHVGRSVGSSAGSQVGEVVNQVGNETLDCFDDLSIGASSMKTSENTKLKKRGRHPGIVKFEFVSFNAKDYVIMKLKHNSNEMKIVVDKNDFQLVQGHSWHISSGKYVGYNRQMDDGTIKEIYLHNLIMNKVGFTENEEREYVFHINKNNLDNRKANLKIVKTQEYLASKNKRKRKIKLPDDCEISIDNIPKYVNYNKASGDHGDRFSIEIPLLNIFWKSSSSNKKTLIDKYNETCDTLKEILKKNPQLDISNETELSNTLQNEFKSILELSEVS